ncbi:MAG: GDSL-type esterase/lipase family protein [Pirellulaceae bacterium]|nr:GDSL-type esterase/lipase family protein [Pirellulaceae bacterium]
MNWLVYHITSGHAFFTGIALVILAVLVSSRNKPIANRIAVLAFLVGAVAIAISSTPIPYWYYVVALVPTVAWVISRYVKSWNRWAPTAMIAVWLVAAAIEIPYHITPALTPVTSRSITVIGDSVTAGMGVRDKSKKWPAILADQHGLAVQNISHMGETAATALKRVKKQGISAPIVIVEIGGNDLLGSTTSAEFELDLNALLAHITAPNRQVIMFELPLPPFCHEYGRIQRALARKHRVALIPKRIFLSVLAADDSTLDTIHLSQAGHDRMANCVWQLIGSAFPPH